jgi:integrase
MPKQSGTDNVRKRCGCVKWKSCRHPWYLDYQQANLRFRENLDKLIGRHAADFVEAKDEARRAIVAKLEGRDPCGLLPADDPTVAQIVEAFDREKPRADRWQVGRILRTELHGPDGLRRLGDWRASGVTPDTLKQFKRLRPLVAGNRDLALLRAVCNWAVLGGLLPRSPFRIGDVSAVKLSREEPRSRRLHPGEDERLLLRAAEWLKDIIVAALETGMRKGEILSLQWHQVRFTPRAELFLPAQKTKAKKDRRVPISSALERVLQARRHDPAGDPLPPEAFVFGDEIGRGRGGFKHPWERLVLKANGHRPRYVVKVRPNAGGKLRRIRTAALTSESRATLRAIGLHFHDLRREAGSRWMDAGVPLATIQRWLGHANIAQTSTYLGASLGNDERDMRAFEAAMGRQKPVTQSDVFAPPNSVQPIRTEPASIENTQQNLIDANPIGSVH